MIGKLNRYQLDKIQTIKVWTESYWFLLDYSVEVVPIGPRKSIAIARFLFSMVRDNNDLRYCHCRIVTIGNGGGIKRDVLVY